MDDTTTTASPPGSGLRDHPASQKTALSGTSSYRPAFLRVRGIEYVRLYADLTVLAPLAQALGQARRRPLAA